MNVDVELISACGILAKTIERISKCNNVNDLSFEFEHILNEAHIAHNSENLLASSVRLILYPQIHRVITKCSASSAAGSSDILLSIQQLRVIYTSVEMLWRLGIANFINQKSSFTLRKQPIPKSFLLDESWFGLFDIFFSEPADDEIIIQYIDCFADVILNETFVIMIDRNIDRILLCIFVLQNGCPQVSKWLGNIRSRHIDGLLLTRLPHFLSGSVDMKDSASRVLTNILISEQGLFTLLREYLEGTGNNPSRLPQLHLKLATLVTSIPTSMTRDSYLSNICQQLSILVIDIIENNRNKHFLKPCIIMISRIAQLNAIMCRQLIVEKLLSALLLIQYPPEVSNAGPMPTAGTLNVISNRASIIEVIEASPSMSVDARGTAATAFSPPPVVVLAEQSSLRIAVAAAHALLLTFSPSSALVNVLRDMGAIDCMFTLLMATIQMRRHGNTSGADAVFAEICSLVENFCVFCMQSPNCSACGCLVHQLIYRPLHRFAMSSQSHLEIHSCPAQLQEFCLEPHCAVPVSVNLPWLQHGAISLPTRSTSQPDIPSSSVAGMPFATPSDPLSATTTGCGGLDEVLQRARIAVVVDSSHTTASISCNDGGGECRGSTSTAERFLCMHSASTNVIEMLHWIFQQRSASDTSPTDGQQQSTPRSSSSNTTSMNRNSSSVCAQLFLRALRTYLLADDTSTGDGQDESDGLLMDVSYLERSSTQCVDGQLREWIPLFTVNNVTKKLLAGILVVLMLDNFSLDILLGNGTEILRTLHLFLTHYAASLDRSAARVYVAAGGDVRNQFASEGDGVAVGHCRERNKSELPLVVEIMPPGAIVESSVTQNGENEGKNRDFNYTETDNIIDDKRPAKSADEQEIVDLVLSLLSGLLTLGKKHRCAEEETLIKACLQPLLAIANNDPDMLVAQNAIDTGLIILGRNTVAAPTVAELSSSSSEFGSDGGSVLAHVQKIIDQYFQHESPAMRAFGVHQLSNLLFGNRNGDRSPKSLILLQASDVAFIINKLVPILSDAESFVYLNALLLFRTLSDFYLEVVFIALHKIYAGVSSFAQPSTIAGQLRAKPIISVLSSKKRNKDGLLEHITTSADIDEQNNSSFSTGDMCPPSLHHQSSRAEAVVEVPVRTRIIIGESLLKIIKRHCSAAPSSSAFSVVSSLRGDSLLAALMSSCIRIARDRVECAGSLDGVANLQSMRIVVAATVVDEHQEEGLGGAKILVQPTPADATTGKSSRISYSNSSNNSCKKCSDDPVASARRTTTAGPENASPISLQSSTSIEAAAATADLVILRLSAISLLAECIVCASYSVQSKFLYDILDISTGILKMERAYNEAERAARRSAAFLVRHIVEEFGNEFSSTSDGDFYLSSCFRAMKAVASTDKDDVVRFQAEQALRALDAVARNILAVPSFG